MNGPANRPKLKVAEKQPTMEPAKPELKLATQEKPKAQSHFLSDLFNKASGKLVSDKQISKAEIIRPPPKKKVPLINSQETLTGPPLPPKRKEVTSTKPDVTSASKIKNRNQNAQKAKESDAAQQRTRIIRSVLVAAAIGIIGFAYTQNSSTFSKDRDYTPPPEQEVLSPQKLQERVRFHRDEIGRKLNRERINVEFQNDQAVPLNARIPKPAPTPDMMAGVPLAAQKPARQSGRDRIEDANPDYSDNRIEYSLAEEQAASDWEKSAQKQYVDDFVANAAKAGYKIKVDATGKVVVLGLIPVPGGPQPSALQNPGFSLPTR